MSKLLAVRYRLLPGEESAVASAAANEPHDFGGELVLTLADGSSVFVSWMSEPEQYSIGYKETSHFVPDADLIDFDVSDTQMWSGLVGREVSLRHSGEGNQVLEATSNDDRLLLCSFARGHWYADDVTVCRQLPAV